ncbi:hypothetical protein [Streptomyces axinellae]|uniref:Shikimate kinase n=1 Tax=Streptomyces axinellae TaxID=552788 RepID=A0ABN3Q364_9ACTN
MNDLRSVLWLGGPPAAGKSTVAQRIARRHGLRWYNSDAHTWEHRDRAVARGHPAAIRYERTPVPERWSTSLEERLVMSLHHERGPMVLEDLRTLPPAPLTIAEGTPITPQITGPHSGVWLLPTPEVQRSRLARRDLLPEVRELYEYLADEIATQVGKHEARTVIIDGSRSVEEVAAEVEALFADALAEGPRAMSPAERRRMLRYANRSFVSQYLTFFTRPWARALGGTGDVVLPFLCECAHESCQENVEFAVADFREPPDGISPAVLAPGHTGTPGDQPLL